MRDRKHLLFLLYVIFIISCNNTIRTDTEKYDTVRYYSNNKISTEEIYKKEQLIENKSFYANGKLHTHTLLDKNTILEKYVFYNNGELMFRFPKNPQSDTGIVYNENGIIKSKGKYIISSHLGEIALKEIGTHISYYESGKVRTITTYDTIGKNGKFIHFYENGIVFKEGFYKNSLFDSIWTYYSEDGNLIKVEKYSNGEITQNN